METAIDKSQPRDIVKRLREISGFAKAVLEQTGAPMRRPCLKAQAADEIERLRDELERLRPLTICGCGDHFSAHDPGTCGNCVAAMTILPGA